jgi:stalled ribosome rescue protein Dom34
LKEGVGSIILASPPRTTYAQEYTDHVRRHHAWLSQGANRVAFAEITGSAIKRSDVATLTKNPVFRKLIQEANAEETENLLGLFESRLGDSSGNYAVLFSLDDVEDLILQSRRVELVPEFLLLTNEYLSGSRQKGRLNRLMQVAANRKVRTRVVDAETPAGKRLKQLGGIVCLAKTASSS